MRSWTGPIIKRVNTVARYPFSIAPETGNYKATKKKSTIFAMSISGLIKSQVSSKSTLAAYTQLSRILSNYVEVSLRDRKGPLGLIVLQEFSISYGK